MEDVFVDLDQFQLQVGRLLDNDGVHLLFFGLLRSFDAMKPSNRFPAKFSVVDGAHDDRRREGGGSEAIGQVAHMRCAQRPVGFGGPDLVEFDSGDAAANGHRHPRSFVAALAQ